MAVILSVSNWVILASTSLCINKTDQNRAAMNILKNQGGLLSSHVAPPVSWLLVIHGERIVRHCGRHSVPLRPA